MQIVNGADCKHIMVAFTNKSEQVGEQGKGSIELKRGEECKKQFFSFQH